MTFRNLTQPFIRYWHWALARGTWWGKSIALGGPGLVALLLVAGIAGGGENEQDAETQTTPALNLVATTEPSSTAVPASPTAIPPTNTPIPATQPPAPTNTQTPPTQAAASVTIISVTSPIARGSTATLNAQASPGANCSITYFVPVSGNVSEAQGLQAKVADATGRVSWSWTIGQGTTPGTGSIRVTGAGSSTTAQIVVT
jgi:micrococcal nuclease